MFGKVWSLVDLFNAPQGRTSGDPPLEDRTYATEPPTENRVCNISEADRLITEIGAKTSDEALRSYSRGTVGCAIGGTIPIIVGIFLYPQAPVLLPIAAITPALYILAYRLYCRYRRLLTLLQK